jgi:tRNA uridine 5-carboxymethylaminomethyl modification enzyme
MELVVIKLDSFDRIGKKMDSINRRYDVVVIGAGHAGAEAALAVARMGRSVALVTPLLERCGWMSCNPAIGGVGKGHLVREIDALGGEMGLNIDATGIQFRRLNTRKGPAVQARRAQADMFEYAARLSQILRHTPGLDLIASQVKDLRLANNELQGVRLADESEICARVVVITTGTFLRGILHTGMVSREGGRLDEASSNDLSACLSALGLPLFRLKTGTPARLDKNTIDFNRLESQNGDSPPLPFSFLHDRLPADLQQIPCYITYTSEQTHEIITSNLDRSPLYSGKIEGIGPRYCPSIEDKVVRFPDRQRHQIFLEPCARHSDMIYPNGISTSLPADVQEQMVRSIEGLEKAKIIHYGYAVEYDAIDPRCLEPWLACREIPGLFFAGQINGTSGYEEAAAQGLIAGINAVLFLQNRPPVYLDRSQAYIGVMIDDLTTRGVTEPYRMFTSRAEYRLLLREDNADTRLTPLGREIGLVSDHRWQRFEQNMLSREHLTAQLSDFKLTHTDLELASKLGLQAPPRHTTCLLDLLNRSDLNYLAIPSLDPTFEQIDLDVLEQISIEIRYAGYLDRQRIEVALFREGEAIAIPEQFDYQDLPGLRTEIKEILSRAQPRSLGQAARIPGITPASLQLITTMLKARSNPNTQTHIDIDVPHQ